jgi:hypothetical protein
VGQGCQELIIVAISAQFGRKAGQIKVNQKVKNPLKNEGIGS